MRPDKDEARPPQLWQRVPDIEWLAVTDHEGGAKRRTQLIEGEPRAPVIGEIGGQEAPLAETG
jgi:hypothetical protein